jgi:hypothetical protein
MHVRFDKARQDYPAANIDDLRVLPRFAQHLMACADRKHLPTPDRKGLGLRKGRIDRQYRSAHEDPRSGWGLIHSCNLGASLAWWSLRKSARSQKRCTNRCTSVAEPAQEKRQCQRLNFALTLIAIGITKERAAAGATKAIVHGSSL